MADFSCKQQNIYKLESNYIRIRYKLEALHALRDNVYSIRGLEKIQFCFSNIDLFSISFVVGQYVNPTIVQNSLIQLDL